MSLAQRIKGYLHYEDIPARGEAHRFRVADDDDDVVKSFATESEAAEYVKEFNARVKPMHIPASWRGHPLSPAQQGER